MEILNPNDVATESLVFLNPEILLVVIDLFPFTLEQVRIDVSKRIIQLASLHQENLSSLSRVGIIRFIQERLHETLKNPEDPLQPVLLTLIEIISAHRLSPVELRNHFQLLNEAKPASHLLKSLLSMVRVLASSAAATVIP